MDTKLSPLEKIKSRFYGDRVPFDLYKEGSISMFNNAHQFSNWWTYGERAKPKTLDRKKIRKGLIFPMMISPFDAAKYDTRTAERRINEEFVSPFIVREVGQKIYISAILMRILLSQHHYRTNMSLEDLQEGRCEATELSGRPIWLHSSHKFVRTSAGDVTDINNVLPSWMTGVARNYDHWVWSSFFFNRRGVRNRHSESKYPYKYIKWDLSWNMGPVLNAVCPQS